MRAVADTSVIVNLFSVFYPDRTETAKRVASLSDEGVIELYAPLFGKFEFAAVMSRYLSEGETLEALSMYEELIEKFVGESQIGDILLWLSLKTHHRVPDLYFIATAMYLDAVLLTNDKRMSELARACGIKSFYLIDESDAFFKSLEVEE